MAEMKDRAYTRDRQAGNRDQERNEPKSDELKKWLLEVKQSKLEEKS